MEKSVNDRRKELNVKKKKKMLTTLCMELGESFDLIRKYKVKDIVHKF